VNRGEIRWYTFKTPDKSRPVLLLTRDSAISFLHSVTIAPITTTIRDIPTEVYLSPADGMLTECAVNLDNIQTVPKAKIGTLITVLSSERMQEVKQAISFALGFDIFF
jgi:mRNA interferase MazF